MTRPLLTNEGPNNEEIRIIGVELAIQPPDGSREVELEMFSCRHTLPRSPYYGNGEIRVTLHCSDGDRTLRGPL